MIEILTIAIASFTVVVPMADALRHARRRRGPFAIDRLALQAAAA